MTTTPNATLRAVRMGLLMSQDDLARGLREAGAKAGVPNEASKRMVQRWESGQVGAPHPRMARVLEMVTGLPISSLGFSMSVPSAPVVENGHGGDNVADSAAQVLAPQGMTATVRGGDYSGIWLSRYEYFSSGRGASFAGLHYVVILQHGNRLTVRSLPGSSDSPLTMDVTAEGNVVTGTWVEQTAVDGYYKGARYYGAIQMLVEPTGRRMTGKWVGFGTEMDVNTGPWELVFQDASTNKATMDKYNQRPIQ